MEGGGGGGGGGLGTPDFRWQGWSKDFFGFDIFDFGIFISRSKDSRIREIVARGIWICSWALEPGIWNADNNRNPEWKFHWQGIRNPGSTSQNPESKTILDYFTWGYLISLRS